MRAGRDYPDGMIQLPASYQEYLAGKSESFINTVRPILMQSAAEKLHGVRVFTTPAPPATRRIWTTRSRSEP